MKERVDFHILGQSLKLISSLFKYMNSQLLHIKYKNTHHITLFTKENNKKKQLPFITMLNYFKSDTCIKILPRVTVTMTMI